MFRLESKFLLGFAYFIILHLIVSETVTLNVTTTKSNETLKQTNETSNQTNDTAPHEFPKNPSGYKFLNNSTILENLKHHAETGQEENNNNNNRTKLFQEMFANISKSSNLSRGVDTEVEDLLHGGLLKTNKVNLNSIVDESKDVKKFDGKNFGNVVDAKSQTELIQNGNNEDTRVINKFDSVSVRDSHGRGIPLVQGQLAAILAGVFVIIAVIGYVGLLSWRRFLENRYGNREMLVNEEEFYDPNDMRHFSL